MEFLIIGLVSAVPLLFLGWLAGGMLAGRHEAELERRGARVAHILLDDLKGLAGAIPGARPPMLLTAEVTLGIDHFRSFLGRLKHLFGGQLPTYEAVLDRARREALTRLKESAHERGFHAVGNVRIAFVDINGAIHARRTQSMVSILALGTAHHRAIGEGSRG